MEYFTKAIELKSDDAGIYINMGESYKNIGNTEKALEYFCKAVEIDPACFGAFNNIGLIYITEYKFEEALEAFNKALAISPNDAGIYLNLGNLSYLTGKMDEAMENFNKAIELNPDYAGAYFNKASVYLINKDFENGWEHYEWRFKKREQANQPNNVLPKPIWDGSSLEGKTIYVYFEQGFGDSLQFVRYLPVLNDMGAKVIFKTHSSLVELLKQSDLKAEILDYAYPDQKVICDTYISIMSIPRLLKTNLENIPSSSGYLKAGKEKVEEFKEKYCNNDSFKIGIKWKGTLKGNQNRQVPLKYFYDIAKLPDVKVYSFQKGPGIEQLQEVPDDINIIDLGVTVHNFADTAAALENMDLIICNDTSLAHLSGALGKPTWILIPDIPEWRWMLDREDSPWYDSVRLFRQKEAGNWEELMQRVIKNINDLREK